MKDAETVIAIVIIIGKEELHTAVRNAYRPFQEAVNLWGAAS
jgi:Flp pilus assembly pilin Flp